MSVELIVPPEDFLEDFNPFVDDRYKRKAGESCFKEVIDCSEKPNECRSIYYL